MSPSIVADIPKESGPKDNFLTGILVVGLAFVWPFTSAWKAATKKSFVIYPRREAGRLATGAIVAYAVFAFSLYYQYPGWMVLATFAVVAYAILGLTRFIIYFHWGEAGDETESVNVAALAFTYLIRPLVWWVMRTPLLRDSDEFLRREGILDPRRERLHVTFAAAAFIITAVLLSRAYYLSSVGWGLAALFTAMVYAGFTASFYQNQRENHEYPTSPYQ